MENRVSSLDNRSWWLRAPGESSFCVMVVSAISGGERIEYNGSDVNLKLCVRPAMWIERF